MLSLRIAHTWDGLPIPGNEQVDIKLVGREGHFEISIDAPFHEDPPPPAPPGPTSGLWNFEVVEFFVAGPGAQYLEVEMGPWGHHLVLRLSGVRRVVEQGLPLDFDAERERQRWTGRAQIRRGWVPEGPHRVNAYAIHGRGAGRRYLAAYPVPGEAPDFHRLDCFEAVTLP